MRRKIFLLALSIAVGVLGFWFLPIRAFAAATIIDHTDLSRFAGLTNTQIIDAAATRIMVRHASVGWNIWDGLLSLQTLDSRLNPTNFDFPNQDRGNPGWSAKITDLINQTAAQSADFDIFTMKLCYIDPGVSWIAYRDAMVSLQNNNPQKKFVWWTIPLTTATGSSDTEIIQRHNFNNQVRNYASANDIILFDIAALESYNPSGVQTTKNISGQPYQVMYPSYSSDGGHLNSTGGQRVAQAFWVMMTDISSTTPSPTLTPTSIPPSPTPSLTPVPPPFTTDRDGDGDTDFTDLISLITNFVQFNIFHYSQIVASLTQPAPSITPVPPPPSADDWSQLAHDAQRTGFTAEDPAPSTDWSFAWHWKPTWLAGTQTGARLNPMPRGAHAVTGGGNIYMPSGTDGLYAINLNTGSESWHKTGITFNAAPAYGTDGYLYAGSANGTLYKLNPLNGNTVSTFNAGPALDHAVLLAGTTAYVTTADGRLISINTSTMQANWTYTAPNNSPATTPPSYSTTNKIIFGTKDLFVHAVNTTNGSQSWRVKPTTYTASDCRPYSYEFGWPVVADQAGIVLIRMRLDYNDTWLWGSGPSGRYPTTNSGIKADLVQYPETQPLFALSLSDGSQPFIPAVGNGGVDDTFTPAASCDQSIKDIYANGKQVSTIGSIPAVKSINNHQVAYIPWRNGQVTQTYYDGRADSHMGEMVLDNNTVSGYSAGDVRFVRFDSGAQTDAIITDEVTPITLANNTLFHPHWAANESITILNRSDNLGGTLGNPITTIQNPYVMRRLNSSGSNVLIATRQANNGLPMVCDTRYYSWDPIQHPGAPQYSFFSFLDQVDPPAICAEVQGGYGDSNRPRYTFVANGKIFIVGNGGDIFALNH